MKTLSTRKQPPTRWVGLLAGTMLVGSVALAFGMIGCGGGGGGGGGGPTGSALIKSGISDPAQECLAPNGPYQSVWVTVTDVKANLSSSASSNSSGWQDLTPNAPATQVNLLGTTTTDCLLATLGTTSGLPAGKYQQIRIFMAPNGSSFSGEPGSNACNTAPANLGPNVWNCVESGGKWYPLTMPSNANTGLKIPPGQLQNGGLTVQNGKGLDLDVDVNACQSVVAAGKSGKYLFKPTLRAGEIGTSPLVAGTLYEAGLTNSTVTIPASSPSPVPGAMVWLEQQASSVAVGTPSANSTQENVDNLIQTTASDSSGHFEFCPVGSGSYEIVANANNMPSTNNLSDTTITTGVNVTSSGGPNNLVIPLVDASGNATTINGTFTTVNTAAVTGDNVQYSPTQPFTGSSGPVQALEPAAMATPSADTQPPTAQTASTPTCTTAPCNNTVAYQLGVANSNPIIGTASSSGSGYTLSAGNATYSVWGSASSISSGSSVCSPSALITNPTTGLPANGVDLTFQSCD